MDWVDRTGEGEGGMNEQSSSDMRILPQVGERAGGQLPMRASPVAPCSAASWGLEKLSRAGVTHTQQQTAKRSHEELFTEANQAGFKAGKRETGNPIRALPTKL